MDSKEYRERFCSILYNLKRRIFDDRTPQNLTVFRNGRLALWMDPVVDSDADDSSAVALLSQWREENKCWFPTQFSVSDDRTKRWMNDQLLEKPDRILFWIRESNGRRIGHIGLYRLRPEDYSCEIDNVMRGCHDSPKGTMTDALSALAGWSLDVLKNKALELKVFANNKRAILLYERCGFSVVKEIPLKKVLDNDGYHWEEANEIVLAERYNLLMRINAPAH